MHMSVRSPHEPCFDRGFFVRGVIVHDDVNVEPFRDAGINLLEEI
jgi:hypothetical protein